MSCGCVCVGGRAAMANEPAVLKSAVVDHQEYNRVRTRGEATFQALPPRWPTLPWCELAWIGDTRRLLPARWCKR